MEQKLQLAAENGNPDAQFNVALQHLENRNDTDATVVAVAWLAKAANQGHIHAQFQLAQLIADVLKDLPSNENRPVP